MDIRETAPLFVSNALIVVRLEKQFQGLSLFPGPFILDPLYRLERYDEALAAFDQSIRLKSNSTDNWNGKGWALYRLERYGEALAAFEQALQFDPDSPDSWDGKANTFRKLKRIQEARHAFEKVHQLRNR